MARLTNGLFRHRVTFPRLWPRAAAIAVALFMAAQLAGCAAAPNRSGKSYVINGKRYHILATAEGFREKGLASWYGEPFHGRKTASGETYDMNEVSAAHKTLPLHTWVEVVNVENGQKLLLRVNDRGPFVDGRIIDLSKAAAKKLGVFRPGTARVMVLAVSRERQRLLNEQRLKARANKGSVASR
jgi:rare lipoprotein A